ncbi:MAG: hypothetical protein MK193_00175 [Lentisphaeria bacterium]|nr:hypothetical protein [Lentisphaeria bacterium]
MADILIDGGTNEYGFHRGLEIKSRRGDIGQTWWSTEFRNAMEKEVDPQELEIGRRSARKSLINSFSVVPGEIEGVFNESRDIKFHPKIHIDSIEMDIWQELFNKLLKESYAVSLLLANRMPETLAKNLEEYGSQLFPEGPLNCSCDCDSEHKICRHVMALGCIICETLDSNPFVLLNAKGLSQDNFNKILETAWGQDEWQNVAQDESITPLEAHVESFYKQLGELDDHIYSATYKNIEVLKSLGYPPFIPSEDRKIQTNLGQLYK